MSKHILHITGCLIGGGAETQLRTLCLKQLSSGYRVTVIYLYAHPFTEEARKELTDAGAQVIYAREALLKNSGNILASVQRCDIIHAHLVHTEFWALLLSVIFRKKLILTRYLPRLSRKRRKLLSYFSLKHAAAVICISETVKEFVLSSFPDASHKTHQIYLGLNPNDLIAQLTDIDIKKDHVLGHKLIAVIPARLTSQKGLIYLLRAIRDSHKKLNEWTFLLVGDGPERQGLELFVATNALTHQIKFLGFKKNIYDYISQADLVVLPSLYEGLGLALLEAMCFAKPIVTTNYSAIKELVAEAALTIDPSDTGAFLKALQQMNDGITRAEYGQKAYQRSGIFSSDKMFTETEKVYQQISS